MSSHPRPAALVAHLVALLLLLSTWTPSALADAPGQSAARALEALTECAAAVVRDDRTAAEGAHDRAADASLAARALLDDADVAPTLGRGKKATRRRADRLVARTAAVAALLAEPATSRLDLVRSTERAARAASRLLQRLAQRNAQCPVILVRPTGGDTVRRGGGRVRLRVVPDDGGSAPGTTVRLAETVPQGAQVADGSLERDRKRDWWLRLGEQPGAVRVEAEACSGTASVWIVVTGPKRALADPLDAATVPAAPVYATATPSFRVGQPAALAAPVVGGAPADSFSVVPPLPEGLRLDPVTGAIAGVPLTPQQAADHVVTAANALGNGQATLRVEVTPALPDGVDELEPGFVVEQVLAGVAVPVKLAFAPDGRLFFNELTTGNVRVVSAAGDLRVDPFHTVGVLGGGERGLLGIALAPDFATSGHVFVYASVPAAGGHPDRNQVLRLTATGDTGGDPVVVVDDLPIGILHNGGDLAFGPDGYLYVSIGDTDDPSLSQTDGSRAGRVLRFAPDGSIPGDNPIAGDPEWCRGLRNPFGLAFHARTGGLFVTENGPTSNDELLFAQPDKNFEWGPVPDELPEFLRGLTLTSWTPVIVPTGITFVSDGALGGAFGDDLFLCSYDLAQVLRVGLSGQLLTDVDEQLPFLAFSEPEGIANKPLDITESPDGALYVSTFSAVWRIRRWSP